MRKDNDTRLPTALDNTLLFLAASKLNIPTVALRMSLTTNLDNLCQRVMNFCFLTVCMCHFLCQLT